MIHNRIFIVLLLVILAALSCVKVRNLEADLYNLIESERAFSRMSKTTGIRDAFMTYLTEEAVVFRPHPVRGRPIYARSGNVPNQLVWHPVFADVSYQGDMGYTTGPYEYRANGANETPSGYGHYVSFWQRQANGNWRVIFDAGISYSEPDTTAGGLILAESRKVSQAFSPDLKEQELAGFYENENAFNRILMDFGYLEAAEKYYGPRIRYYRNGFFPLRPRKTVLERISEDSYQAICMPDTAIIAESYDLGMTYGTFRTIDAGNPEDWSQYSYLRIWKKESENLWRIVLDLALPISTGLITPSDIKDGRDAIIRAQLRLE